jgi:hypothetical protein
MSRFKIMRAVAAIAAATMLAPTVPGFSHATEPMMQHSRYAKKKPDPKRRANVKAARKQRRATR